MDAASILAPAEPAVAATPGRSDALLAAYEDYARRVAEGESVDPEAFCARHPGMQRSLARLISVHHFITDSGPVAWPEVGQPYLGFHLEHCLGQGAFARVYRATQPDFGGRRVALKVSRAGAGEAMTLGRAAHPHVVPVYSTHHDPDTGLSALCMPYLGHATLLDLIDRLRAEPTTPDRGAVILGVTADPLLPTDRPAEAAALAAGSYVDGVRRLAARVADALAFLHARGIVHRDLKPSNVLLTPAGEPLLLDFNLSADTNRADARLGGTLLYMAPEQLAEGGAVDGRADLYALGLILHELLTGRHPFDPVPLTLTGTALRAFLIEQQLARRPSVRELNPAVDTDLAALVDRCLCPDPAGRPPSADSAAAALRPRVVPAPMPRRRRGLWAVLILLFGLCGGSLLAVRPSGDPAAVRSGYEAARQGRHADAVSFYTRALQAAPEDPAILIARGRAYLHLGDEDRVSYHRALDDFQAAYRIAPAGRAKALQGHTYHRLGDFAAAYAAYEAALALGHAPAEVLNNLGHAALQMRRLAKAEEYIGRALVAAPELAAAHHNQAILISRKSGSIAGAAQKQQYLLVGIEHARRALILGPVSGELHRDAASLCAEAARTDPTWRLHAVDHFEAAVAHGVGPPTFMTQSSYAHLHDEPRFQRIADLVPGDTRRGLGHRVLPPADE